MHALIQGTTHSYIQVFIYYYCYNNYSLQNEQRHCDKVSD